MTSDLRTLLGQELAGFRLTELLGEGGMAVVFKGENVMNRSIVRAIKVVRPELSSRDELTARFAEEALVLERLSHRNIVRFFGLRTDRRGDDRYVVMELELLEGRTLSQAIRRSPEPPSIRDAVLWFVMAARGVAAAHSIGVVHRDIKPENIFLDDDGNVRVLDFGIARAVDEADRAMKLTVAGTVPGSPPYMAPEVCSGAVPTMAADVYALGMSLCETLLGHHPFVKPGEPFMSSTQLMFAQIHKPLPSVRALRHDVPPNLEEVVVRATAKDPSARYPSAKEMAEALEQLVPVLAAPSEAPRAEVSTQFAVPHITEQAAAAAPTVAEVARAGGTPAPAPRRGLFVAGALLLGAVVVGLAASAATGGPGTRTEPVAAPPAAAAETTPSCPTGMARSEDTDGHCCWPAQAWSGARAACVGTPTECRGGQVADGDECRCGGVGYGWYGDACRRPHVLVELSTDNADDPGTPPEHDVLPRTEVWDAATSCLMQEWNTRGVREAAAELTVRYAMRLHDMGTYDVYEPSLAIASATGDELGSCIARSLATAVPPRAGRVVAWSGRARVAVSLVTPSEEPEPTLEPQVVRSVVAREQRRLQSCWETAIRGMREVPTTRLDVDLVIGADGAVWHATVRGVGLGTLNDCIDRSVRGWRFPASDGTTTVSFPVVFQGV